MVAAARFAKGNRLLQMLSADDRDLLEPHFTSLGLELRRHFEYPNKPIESVYFLNRGVASVVAEQPNGAKAEIGIIGCEGTTGTVIVLGDAQAPAAIGYRATQT